MMTFQEALNGGKAETFSVYKTDDDKRLVFGWASVAVTVDGEQLEDRQHDIIDPEELERAAYEYVLNFGDTGEEHDPSLRKKGKLVESCVFTREKQRAMGLPEGILPEGWWIGFRIEDDDAWQKVKDGTYRMFSIEGTAERTPVEKAAQEATGCGVLVLRDGKVLTGTRIERAGRGRLCGPGGHIEEGETPEEAAVREAEEEFDIVCRDLRPLGVQDGGGRYETSAVFLCTDYDGEPRTDEREMTEPRWLDPAEIRAHENVFPPFRQSLELLPVRKAMTFREALLKGNPYHDPADGKFTFAPGGARARHHHTPPTIPGGTLRSGGPGHHGGGIDESEDPSVAEGTKGGSRSKPVTNTPQAPLAPTYGHKNMTKEWMDSATPNSHKVTDVQSFEQDGVLYETDGTNVKLDYSPHEKKTAELLESTFGGECLMMPKVSGKFKGIKTPDFLFRGERFDLKDLETANKDAVYNAIHKRREQADNFVINFSDSGLLEQEAVQQVEQIFRKPYTAFVKRIILIDGEQVIGVYERE